MCEEMDVLVHLRGGEGRVWVEVGEGGQETEDSCNNVNSKNKIKNPQCIGI